MTAGNLLAIATLTGRVQKSRRKTFGFDFVTFEDGTRDHQRRGRFKACRYEDKSINLVSSHESLEV